MDGIDGIVGSAGSSAEHQRDPRPVRRGRWLAWAGGIGVIAVVVSLVLHSVSAVTPAGTQIRVGEYPNYLAVARGSLFADFGGGQTVTPFNLATGKSGKPIPVGVGPSGMFVAGGILCMWPTTTTMP
jgi:hypothetical protein